MRAILLGLTFVCATSFWAHTAQCKSHTWMGPTSGAPGETDCTSCHAGTANTPPGSIWISAPGQYVPDDTLMLFASLESAGQIRWGFEFTALNSSGQPVGQLIISDAANTRISTDAATGRQYVFHTASGTYDGKPDSSSGWTFRWVAPAAGAGDVTFYMAGLAANSSGSSGDRTFTTSASLSESILSDVGDDAILPGGFALDQNYPNPFNPQTAVSYRIPRAAEVQIAIYNALGQQVCLLEDGLKPAGHHTRLWNGTDRQGRAVAAGVYFYRLVAGDYMALRKMLLLK